MRFLAFFLSLFFILPLWAATPMPLQGVPLKTLKQSFQLDNALITRSSTPNQLHFIQEHQGPHHLYHIRLQQYYKNIPVYGGETIMHSSKPFSDTLKSNLKVSFTGTLFNKLDQDLGPVPDFTNEALKVLSIAKKPYVDSQITQESITPIIFLDDLKQAHWAYQINLFLFHPNQRPAAVGLIVDAQTYQPYLKWNDLKTQMRSAEGIGYGGNPTMGNYTYGQDHASLLIQYNPDEQRCYLANDHAQVIDMEHNEHHNVVKPMSFPCESSQAELTFWTGLLHDGYDKVNGGNSPSNDALFSADIIKKLYNEWYGLEPLVRKSGAPMKLIMRVHFGKNYDNAYWDGKQMTFGDGDKKTFYPLVSLGVSAHEISHGFTQQHSDLFYYGQSGAINEAFSDMADKAAEYYAGYALDWRIGWEIFKPQSQVHALRYMDLPSKDGASVDSIQGYILANKASYEKYGDALDVHLGSGVFNRLFYILATTNNWDIHKAFDVMVFANVDYWTRHVDFQTAACGILYATKDLKYPTVDVSNALVTVGLNPSVCTPLEVA